MFYNKRILLLLFFITWNYSQLIAQLIDKAVIEKYNSSVVSKLFSVVKYVDIDKELQLRLAYSIYAHDSTVVSWISLGKSKGSIDTLQQVAQFQLYGMLSKEQLQTLRFNSTFDMSNAIADGEAQYLYNEYKPDSFTYSQIKRSLSHKYNFILQNFSDNYLMNQNTAIDYTKSLNGVYDSYKYFPFLYSKKYVEEYIRKLQEIKKIPKDILSKIEHTFYNLVWQNKYSDWSLAAENSTRIHFPDTAIFSSLHRIEIEQEVVEDFVTERYNLIFREHVSEDAFKRLEPLVKEKSYRKSVLKRTYASSNTKLYDWLLRQTMDRYDSTIKATLIYDGGLQPATQFAIALKYKSQLHLRPSLCDTLVRHAMFLEKQRDSIFLRDPYASIDFAEYETKYLSRLLTEEQYNTVLFHRNRTYAAANALTDWQEMVVRGLDMGFLKDQAIKEMTEYYISKNAAWCRYANDKIKLWANLYALDQIKPKALKVLDPIRWSGSTQKSNNNLQMQW